MTDKERFDLFAAHALTGIVAGAVINETRGVTFEQIAEEACNYAIAMLHESREWSKEHDTRNSNT